MEFGAEEVIDNDYRPDMGLDNFQQKVAPSVSVHYRARGAPDNDYRATRSSISGISIKGIFLTLFPSHPHTIPSLSLSQTYLRRSTVSPCHHLRRRRRRCCHCRRPPPEERGVLLLLVIGPISGREKPISTRIQDRSPPSFHHSSSVNLLTPLV